jgi:hypothetical protein
MFLLFQFASLAIQDPSPKLRTEGCRILGTMESIPSSILELTLCKKSSLHAAYFQQTLDSFGLSFGIMNSQDRIRLLDPNICFGAFIHATEDEFAVVRSAAIGMILFYKTPCIG